MGHRFFNAQASQTLEAFPEITSIADEVHMLFSTESDGGLWSSFSTTWQTLYVKTVRVFTTTGDEGQTQILAEVTVYSKGDAPMQSATGSVASSAQLSAQPSAQATASATDSSMESSPATSNPTLSIPAVAGISLDATSTFLVLIGALFLIWRWRRQDTKTASSHGQMVDLKLTAVSAPVGLSAKPELHATERALYEMDGKDPAFEADGTKILGELEDKQSTAVAREMEGRRELPTRLK